MYNYACYHIRGGDNVWADLQGRSSVTPTLHRLLTILPLVSASVQNFSWPSPAEILKAQTSASP